MSLKYRDHNGVSRIISGITPGGDLEYGAVATRSGTFVVPATNAGATSVVSVSFSSALPDTDYEVTISSPATIQTSGLKTFEFVIFNKTISGFQVNALRTASSASGSDTTFNYKAFKLYEVADAEQLYSTVQDLEAMVPANASSTNKFTTADDLRTETRTLDRRLDDVEDVVPTSASITNKLVTQNDLSGVEIDKVEDINDVELTNIADGQTLIWDDTNSKWVNGQGGKIYTAGDGINISNTDEISAKVDDTSITTDTNDALKVADTYKTIFVGTRAQWDALSTTDKVKYNEAHITDDVIGGEVADEVTNGLMSPVTSNAVYDYPIDSIADGQHRPPTSNAVYDALALKQNSLLVERVYFDSMQTVSGVFDISLSVAKTGYTALGAVGWSFENRTSVYITSVYILSNTCHFLGFASTSTSAKPFVIVLYAKN